jgi:hypothetical protein
MLVFLMRHAAFTAPRWRRVDYRRTAPRYC